MYFSVTTPTKNVGDDRILSLELIDGKAPLSSTGLIDKRLFRGENKLHAIKDTQTCLWYMKYDDGLIPEPLRQRFTTFSRLFKTAEDYFTKRNVKITEIID